MIAATMSYYSLHIWNYDSEEEDLDWNPGDSDPIVADKMADALKLAWHAAEESERFELEQRLDFVQEAESQMDGNDEDCVWWRIWPPRSDFGIGNLTGLFNGTGMTRNRTIANG